LRLLGPDKSLWTKRDSKHGFGDSQGTSANVIPGKTMPVPAQDDYASNDFDCPTGLP
jgi:hypothetical protein